MGVPFDKGRVYSQSVTSWTEGSGYPVPFIQEGDTQNWRSYQPNDVGDSTLTWKISRNPNDSSGEVPGWYLDRGTLDNIDLDGNSNYRESVWIYKNVAGSGEFERHHSITNRELDGRRLRFLNQDLNLLDGTTEMLDSKNLSIDTLSDTTFPPNQWFLAVNHIYAWDTNFGDPDYLHPDSGIYYPDGTRLDLTNIDLYDGVFTYNFPVHILRNIRTYYYLQGSGTPVVQHYQPRLDVVGNTAPSIDWLLIHCPLRVVSTNLGHLLL